MMGPDIQNLDLKGIIPRMVTTVFDTIENSGEYIEYTVKVGYAEIYMEKIRDLLNPAKCNLNIHEDKNRGMFIADLTEEYVSDREDVYDLMTMGSSNREVGATNMNAGSSRSHSLFMITITQNNTMDYSAKSGKLYLVDLAGSEKVGKTGAEGKRLDEAKNINKSLSALGKVIYALTDKKQTHIPYRDSKLTRVLQDSLGGNSKTALIITCSPARFNEHETLSTLRFGRQALAIKNKPRINKELTVAELKLLLSRAEETIGVKNWRILALERTILNLGGDLPSENTQDDALETEEAFETAANEDLIQELDLEREKFAAEKQRADSLQAVLDGKVQANETLRTENERLISRYSGESLKVTSLKERVKEKDEQLERLNGILESINSDLRSVNAGKVQLEQQLLDKEYECNQLEQQSQRSSGRGETVSKLIDEKEALESELHSVKSELASKIEYIQSIQQNESISLVELREKYEAKNRDNVELKFALREAKESIECIKETLPEAMNEYKDQVESLTDELQAEKENSSRLRMEISDLKEDNATLNDTIAEGDVAIKKKVNSLEAGLEKLTLIYHQTASQNSVLKVDKQVHEKKILRKNERCQTLEKALCHAREKLQSYKLRLCTMESELSANKIVYSSGKTSMNIRKMIVGGRKKVLKGSTENRQIR